MRRRRTRKEVRVFSAPSAAPREKSGSIDFSTGAKVVHTMPREIDDISGEIVDAAYKLHIRLGPGLLESVYEAVLARELERRGLKVERQKLLTL